MSFEIKKRLGECPRCKKLNHHMAPEVPGDLCDACQNAVSESYAIVVCSKCHSLAAVVEPGVDENGNAIEAGQYYQTRPCKRCNMDILDLEKTEGPLPLPVISMQLVSESKIKLEREEKK